MTGGFIIGPMTDSLGTESPRSLGTLVLFLLHKRDGAGEHWWRHGLALGWGESLLQWGRWLWTSAPASPPNPPHHHLDSGRFCQRKSDFRVNSYEPTFRPQVAAKEEPPQNPDDGTNDELSSKLSLSALEPLPPSISASKGTHQKNRRVRGEVFPWRGYL